MSTIEANLVSSEQYTALHSQFEGCFGKDSSSWITEARERFYSRYPQLLSSDSSVLQKEMKLEHEIDGREYWVDVSGNGERDLKV